MTVFDELRHDSWNWVRRMHVAICLVLIGFVVITFTLVRRDAIEMRVTTIVMAVIFIGQHVLITSLRRWNRFDDV